MKTFIPSFLPMFPNLLIEPLVLLNDTPDMSVFALRWGLVGRVVKGDSFQPYVKPPHQLE